MELEDARGAESTVDTAEANVMEQDPPLLRSGGSAAVAAF